MTSASRSCSRSRPRSPTCGASTPGDPPIRPRSSGSRQRRAAPPRRSRREARSWWPSPIRSRRRSRGSTRPTRSRRPSPTSTSRWSRRIRRETRLRRSARSGPSRRAAASVRLHLRPGVVFSDGAPVDARAVKASLERTIRLSRDQLPAALAAIRGAAAFAEGTVGSLDGIDAVSDAEIRIGLADPLPIFPSLLTDPRTAIVAEGGDGGAPVGTGPFRVALHSPDRVVLERNPHYGKEPARVDRIEFRAPLAASAIAQGLRAGELDIVRDLLPADREAILRDPRLRAGLAEIPKKNTYFAVFHSGSAGRIDSRRASGALGCSPDAGPGLGHAGEPRAAGDGPDPARHSGARRGEAPGADPARPRAGDGPLRRAAAADPAAGGGPPDPARSVRDVDAGALRDLVRARRRGRSGRRGPWPSSSTRGS